MTQSIYMFLTTDIFNSCFKEKSPIIQKFSKDLSLLFSTTPSQLGSTLSNNFWELSHHILENLLIFTGCFIGILATLMHNGVIALDEWGGCFLNDHNLTIVSSISRTLLVFTRYFIYYRDG